MAPEAELPIEETTPELETAEADVTEQQSEQEAPVTRKELAAAVEEGFRRASQSAKSRAQAIENQVKNLTETMKKLNVDVTPEMTSKLREQATAEIDQSQQQAQQPNADDAPGTGNPVYDWTMAIYKEEGLDIKPTDPEWKLIKAALDDPNGNMPKYQRTVLRAIDTKRTRTTSASETASARVIGAGGEPSGQAPATSARALWERAHTTK